MRLINSLKFLRRQKGKLLFILCATFMTSIVFAQTNIINDTPKERLVKTIKNWVALQEGIDETSVVVQANDRRFIVPDCEENFNVSFAFGTRTNVQIDCNSEDWQAVLRIQIIREHETLVFSRALNQGDVVSQDDLRISTESSLIPGSNLISATEAEGRLLKISVDEGQIVRPNQFDETSIIFLTNRDIKEGEKLDRSMIQERKVAASDSLFEQRLDLSLALNATVTRDLESGIILTKRDFAISSQAMVITELIERGNMIDTSNSELKFLITQIPSDAILQRSQVQRASAKRRLNPGEVLRFSDITLMPHVISDTTTTLELNKQSFSLTMEVLAIESGFIGDRIRVQNRESGEIIYATVTGVGLVEIR